MSLQIKGVRTEDGNEITVKDRRNQAAGKYLIAMRNADGQPVGGLTLTRSEIMSLVDQLLTIVGRTHVVAKPDVDRNIPVNTYQPNTSLDHSTQLHAELAANPFVK